jgi:COP9 signalosome complex subunit 12
MDDLFRDFQQAHLAGSGPLLSTTLIPIAPADDPSRLRRLALSSSTFQIQADIRAGLLAHSKTEVRFSKSEGNAWVDVFTAYWKAVWEIVAIEEGGSSSWTAVYDGWKEVTNSLIKGYSSAGFEAWTVPCLYVAGRYLRIFAIKADEHASGAKALSYDDGMQEDIAGDLCKNERLEDAARIINRIFTLCISDRYAAYSELRIQDHCHRAALNPRFRAPIGESRKWGLYYTTNLLFKTYFKVMSSTRLRVQRRPLRQRLS